MGRPSRTRRAPDSLGRAHDLRRPLFGFETLPKWRAVRQLIVPKKDSHFPNATRLVWRPVVAVNYLAMFGIKKTHLHYSGAQVWLRCSSHRESWGRRRSASARAFWQSIE